MPIQRKLVQAVDDAADRSCCLCRRRGDHLHYLNRDPDDQRFENLVLLCFVHHEEALRSPMAEDLVRVRAAWYEKVRARRAQPPPAQLPSVLRAILVHEVRKLRYELQHRSQDWPVVEGLIRRLQPHADEGDAALRKEVMDALDVAAAKTRAGMPPETARALFEVAAATAIRGSLVVPEPRKNRDADRSLLESAAYVGFVVAHDGAKYLHSLPVVDAGANILAMVLRYAHLNKLRRVEARARTYFEKARKQAADDAARWLQFKEADAVAPDAAIPDDVARQLRE